MVRLLGMFGLALCVIVSPGMIASTSKLLAQQVASTALSPLCFFVLVKFGV